MSSYFLFILTFAMHFICFPQACSISDLYILLDKISVNLSLWISLLLWGLFLGRIQAQGLLHQSGGF